MKPSQAELAIAYDSYACAALAKGETPLSFESMTASSVGCAVLLCRVMQDRARAKRRQQSEPYRSRAVPSVKSPQASVIKFWWQD